MSQQGPSTTDNPLQDNLVQTVYNSTSALFITTSILPHDDTIPQQTEGIEFLTVTITPTSATNLLDIKIFALIGIRDPAGASAGTVALFQDATANALAATCFTIVTGANEDNTCGSMNYRMVAGTTSPTTFKLRAGVSALPETLSINGRVSGTRLYGGVANTSITVYEVQP